MDSLVFLIGFIVLCFVVIVAAGFFEARLKKRKESQIIVSADDGEGDGAGEEVPEFVVGRIYQMEDGSFVKYAGGGKFLRVRKE